MKGTFNHSPLEYSLNIRGESWKQGERLRGSLKVKNTSSEELNLSNYGVTLAFGDIKKLHSKKDKAFTNSAEVLFEDLLLAPNSEENLSFQFQLDKDCPITEKASSLYVLCGEPEKPFEGGLLQLAIAPYTVISNFTHVLETIYRCKIKSLKNKKGQIEAKVQVPDSKSYAAVQALSLLMRLTGDQLELSYTFKLKVTNFEHGIMGTKDEVREIKSVLSPDQYQIYGDSPNQEGIGKAIDEVLEQIKTKSFL